MGTEQVQDGYGMGTGQIANRYRMGTRTHMEHQQNVFCQAFPVRFLLIGTVRETMILNHIIILKSCALNL